MTTRARGHMPTTTSCDSLLPGGFELLVEVSTYRELNGFLTVNDNAFSFGDAPT